MLVTECVLYIDESHRYLTCTHLLGYTFTFSVLLTVSPKHEHKLKGLYVCLGTQSDTLLVKQSASFPQGHRFHKERV